ncbi:MAG: alpha/beta hydrolase [Sporolactobacillus sp.]
MAMYCRTDLTDVYYEDMGKGTPIVMLHGFAADHRLLSGCMEPLFQASVGWRRLYLDLPGMGQTKAGDVLSADAMLDMVLQCVDRLLPGQSYALVGESYGGYLARGIIERRRQRVCGAAFICPVIKPWKADRTVSHQHVTRTDQAWLDTLPESDRKALRQTNDLIVQHALSWRRLNEEVRSGLQLADLPALKRIRRHYAFSFALDRLPFEQPSLFLLGRQDATVGYQDALGLTEQYPRSTYAVLDLAGHNLQIDQPDVFNRLMKDWLARVAERADRFSEGEVH